MMSMNLVKLLTQQQKSIFEENAKDTGKTAQAAKPAEPAPKQEVIVVTPVQELSEKISNKTLLTREDMILLTQVLQKEFTSDPKKYLKSSQESEKLRDFLWLIYYSLLNAHPLTQNASFLVREALSKLVKETLHAIQLVLDLLSQKTNESLSVQALLFNRSLPPIFKILSLFQGNAKKGQSGEVLYLSEHYKYLRSTTLKRLDTLSLQSLNQVFTELKKGIVSTNQDKKQTQQKGSDIIQIAPPKAQVAQSDDFMTSMLEFAPAEYLQVVQQISAQITASQERKSHDEAMSQGDEEEHKGSGAFEKVSNSATEIIKSTKLIEKLSTAIDIMVGLCESAELQDFFLIIESDLVRHIRKHSLTLGGFNPSKLSDFLNTLVPKIALNTKKSLQELFAPVEKDQRMETDEPKTKQKILEEQRLTARRHSLTLAKSLEIIKQRPLAEQVQILSEIFNIEESQAYIRKLLENLSQQDSQPVKTIASTFSSYLNLFVLKFSTLNPNLRLAYLHAQTEVVFIAKKLSDISKSTEEVKFEPPSNFPVSQISSDPLPIQQELSKPPITEAASNPFDNTFRGGRSGRGGKDVGGIRTRSQLRNTQPGEALQPKKEEQKKPAGKKQAAKVEKESAPQPVLVKIDADDLLKETLSMLSQLMQNYFTQDIVELNLPILKNLKRLYKEVETSKVHISRLLLGVLSYITKVKGQYTQASLSTIKDFALSLLSKKSETPFEIVFSLKLIFLVNNQGESNFLGQVSELLISSWDKSQDSLTLSKGGHSKFVALISCLFLLSQKAEYLPIRQRLVEHAKTISAPLHLMQLVLLKPDSLDKYKSVIQKFVTLSPTVTETVTNLLNSLAGELERVNNGLFNSPEPAFDKVLLPQVSELFKLESIIARLKSQYQVKGSTSASEVKQRINGTLKAVAKITSEIGQSQDDGDAADLEAFIAIQMSMGNTNTEVTNSRFELNSTKQMQDIISKTKQKQDLSQDQIDFIDSQLRSLKYFNDTFLQPAIATTLQDLLPSQSKHLAPLLIASLKGQHQPSKKLATLIQSLAGQKSSIEQELLTLVTDQCQLEKHVFNHRSNSTREQETIYAHCFSVCSVDKEEDRVLGDQYQSLTSAFILMKVLYTNLYQFATALSSLDQYKESVRPLIAELSRDLLRVKFDCPFLELNDSGNTYDYDLNEKLLEKLGQSQHVANRDMLKYRQFEAAVQILQRVDSLDEGGYNQVGAIAVEVANQGLTTLNTKGNAEMKLLLAFFKAEQVSSPLSNAFTTVLSHSMTPEILWTLALRYSLKPHQDANSSGNQMVSKENKGGVSMEIQFNETNRRKRPHFAKVQFDESHKANDENDSQPKQYFNPIAQRLFSIALDALQSESTSSDEYKRLSNRFRDAYLAISEDVAAPLFLALFKPGQQALLKKLLYAIYPQNKDLISSKEQREQLQSKIFRSLVFMIQNLQSHLDSQPDDNTFDSKSALLFVIEIAIIITESNIELIKFISQEILQGASRLLGGIKGNILKLVVLDLLCQLAQSRFTEAQNGTQKYSIQQIKDRRKQYQEARKKNEEQRKKLLSQSQAVDDGLEEAKNAASVKVEGFREDKVNLEEQQAKYMELPQEVCTYNSTKKEFKMQHWYWCFTCRLVDNSGCCAVCANRCHRGHQVVYSKKSNFFCDCGDSGKCKSLKAPEKPKDSTLAEALKRGYERNQDRDNDSRHPRLSDRGMLFSQNIGMRDEGPTGYSRAEHRPMGASRGDAPPRFLMGEPPEQHYNPYSMPFRPSGPSYGSQAQNQFIPISAPFPPQLAPTYENPPPEDFGLGQVYLPQELRDPALFGILPPRDVEDKFNLESEIMRQIVQPGEFRGPMNVLSESSDDEIKDNPRQDPIERRIHDFGDMDSDEERIIEKISRPQGAHDSVRKMMRMIKQVPGRLNERGPQGFVDRPRGHHFQQLISQQNQANYVGPRYGAPSHDFGMPQRMEYGMPQFLKQVEKEINNNLEQSESQVSVVNPLEDPMSEASLAPLREGDFINFSQLSSQVEDQEMPEASEGEFCQEIVEALKAQQSHFDEVFNHLMSLVEDSNKGLQASISSQGKLDLNVSISGGQEIVLQDLPQLLSKPKQSQVLTQDLASVKKNIKDNTFKFKLQQQDMSQNATQQNINLLDTIDSNRDGLVAICEDQEVNFYGGSQFFEEQGSSQGMENFNFSSSGDNQALGKVETHKSSFQPLAVKYNPLQPQYLAVIGAQNAEVVVLNKSGKVQYKVSVDLLLETISRDLTIVNVKWVPGSQTLLAIAARDFVKIYDLASDTLSPIKNIMIFNGQINDFTFGVPVATAQDPQKQYSTRIYVASNQGLLYHHELTFSADTFNKDIKIKNEGDDHAMIDANQVKNCELMLTETVQFNQAKYNIRQGSCSLMSVHCSQQCKNLIFISVQQNNYGYGGNPFYTLVGQIEGGKHEFDGFKLDLQADAAFNNNSSHKSIWQNQGQNIVAIKDLSVLSDKALFLAFSRRQHQNYTQHGIPLMIQISDSKVEVNLVKSGTSNQITPALGQAFVAKSVQGSTAKRLVNILADGSAVAYQCTYSAAQDSEFQLGPLSSNGRLPEVNLDKLVARSDLPREVKLSVNYYEKARNIMQDAGLRQKLTIGGDIATYHKTSKATIEKLAQQSNNAQIQENGKKQLRMQFKLDNNTDMIIIGFRLKLDFSQCKDKNQGITMKLFNRHQKMTNYNQGGNANPLWFDFPFCDAEALYASISMSNATFDMVSDDAKGCPIRICQVDVYAMGKREFMFKEKVKKLEKMAADRLAKMQGASVVQLTEAQKNDLIIKEELLQSKTAPLVSWKEKVTFLRNELNKGQVNMIESIDVITQYLSIVNTIDHSQFTLLYSQLLTLLQRSYAIKSDSELYVIAAIKRCIRKLLSALHPDAPLGDANNYQTLKDTMLVNAVAARINSADLNMLELRKYLKRISKIHDQRYFQLFKILEAQPFLTQSIVEQYLRLFKHSSDFKEANNDIREIVNLVIAEVQRKVNVNDGQIIKSTSSITEAIDKTYDREDLAQAFTQLLPLLSSEHDIIQKITVSALLTSINNNSTTMEHIVKHNQLPSLHYSSQTLGATAVSESKKIELLIIDICPFLLKFAFGMLNGHITNEIAYQIVFKVAKQFEKNSLEKYEGKFIERLLQQVERFIKGTLASQASDPLVETESMRNRSLYANFVMANAFLHNTNKEGAVKIKDTQVCLSQSSRNKIIQNLGKDKEFVARYVQWINALLQQYYDHFNDQKGSVRTKFEDGIPTSQVIMLKVNGLGGNGGKGNLLRPVHESSQWKWHPLFTKTDSQFEYLDRKLPAQILLNLEFLVSKFDSLSEVDDATQCGIKLLQNVKQLAFKKPSKALLKPLGEQVINSLLTQLSSSNAQKIEAILKVRYKDSAAYEEFYEVFEHLYQTKIAAGQALSFNVQFLLHSLMQKLWKKASRQPVSWQYFVLRYKDSSRFPLISFLAHSVFLLNDETAQLCLQLCALAFEKSIVISFRYIDSTPVNLFQVFQKTATQHQKEMATVGGSKFGEVDINRLVDVMLLGRNKKQIRVAAAHFIKGIYDVCPDLHDSIKDILIEKLPQLRTKGVNSLELVALLSYVINSQIQINGAQRDKELYKRLSREVFRQIERTNSQLTGHENLEIYAALQRMTTAFSGQAEMSFSLNEEQLQKNAELAMLQEKFMSKNQKITNPYLLENEACQKCFSQKSLPFQQHRLNDIKQEAKFTDSTMIYRFNTTYQIKQITFNQDNFRGNKVIRELQVFVNNKQGIDLADMKKNWSLWQKVKSQELEVGQRQTVIEFTLPVNATNLLIYFITGNTNKQVQGKAQPERREKKAKKAKMVSEVENISQVQGLDSVLTTLPKAIACKFGVITGSSDPDGSAAAEIVGEEQMQCPRCGKQVQGKHGICNSCGENAMQCNYCRNINYEKPDGYLCNECGNSRFAKFDIGITLKQGFACEKIETEEAKTQALQQIEQQLQTAQNAYQQLMNKRQIIAGMMKKLNDGGTDSGKQMADMYQDECAELYLKMMRSLNSIKTLKIEIDQYLSCGVKQQATATKLESSKSKDLALTRARSCISTAEDDQVQENCFSCIQEYLKGLLNFVKATADTLNEEFQGQGFLKLLYQQNIKMYAAQLQKPARKAICQLVKTNEAQAIELLKQIQTDLFSKKDSIPAHLLAQNITQETHLILELLMMQVQVSGKDGSGKSYYHAVLKTFWSIIFNALKEGQFVAPIADLVASQFIGFIRDSFKHQNIFYATELQELQYSLFDEKNKSASPQLLAIQQAQSEYLSGQNYLMFAVTLKSSQRVRTEAKTIISTIISNKPQFAPYILKHLLATLDSVLLLESSSGDQYFDLLVQLLNPQIIKEKITELSLKKESETHIFIEAFDKLFKTIESELSKLVQQEQVRASLGQDGFMPQISTGQIFSRVVSLVSLMIKESVHLKAIIQSNVNIVIKSFLKIRKLNLTKNKLIQQSEVEIEKMFKELHSQREEEKENFVMECLKIIESGDCDFQEMRFLFEEMCKVIDPVKPEPDYLLHLTRAQSQEFYFRGKMSKNPYSITQLGKTMADVRLKICKEMDLAEPELVELLVCGKLVGMDLSIRQVYEQVQWPHVWKQKNPDAYDIPPIDEAPKNMLQPMNVIYRLMGIDGEAQEDRVDSLQDGSEADNDPANIMKKYGITQVFCKPFDGKDRLPTTGIKVLVDVLENFGSLQQQRYLAEWLFKLFGYSLKIKSVRKEFMKYKETVDNFAKRLFESVGMQSQIEGQKGMTLFDVILGILDTIIVELNEQQDSQAAQTNLAETSSLMEIDQKAENLEAATHVQLFVKILNDSCNEMIANNQSIDKTSKKIKAVSKILPFLINQEDISAQKIVIDFIGESSLKIPLLDNLAELTAKEKFSAQFSLERVIEIIESIPSTKGYFKDHILESCGQLMESMWNYLLKTTLVDLSNEQLISKHKLANQYTLRFLHSLTKNHPATQASLFQNNKALVDRIYELAQAKYNDRSLIVLANDILESLTNKNLINDPNMRDYLQKQIDQQKDEQKKLAAKKREEIMKKMQAQKNANKFMKQLDNPILQEETGPRCIVCQEGYTKKPTEVLGLYVFSKKLKIKEISQSGKGFTNTVGYTTVTHSNFIHFVCHQNAYRADSQLKQPKKEWEGAVIRNAHTKCNNLMPLRGGNLPIDSYGQMVERYFQNLHKTVSQCDNDKVKVLLHDFKLLMKRLAYEDSFSRDTQGGGPEHNMHLIAFFSQMIQYIISQGAGFMGNQINGGNGTHTFIQEQKIAEFLEQGMQLKKDFLQKLEEEKKQEEFEEESKMMDEGGAGAARMDEDDESGQMGNFSLDQIALMLTKCLMFCQLPQWESTYKHQFFSIILCSVAGMKDDAGEIQSKPLGGQSDLATGKKVLSITKDADTQMTLVDTGLAAATATPSSKRGRLGSDIKGTDQLNRALIRLRPLLVLLRLVDAIKRRWDGDRLQIATQLKGDAYLKRLVEEVLAKGNLKETIGECDEVFRVYKDRILKIGSVEEFMEDMNMITHIQETLGDAAKGQPTSQLVEQYVLSHFAA